MTTQIVTKEKFEWITNFFAKEKNLKKVGPAYREMVFSIVSYAQRSGKMTGKQYEALKKAKHIIDGNFRAAKR